jgi:hypothetical protein
VQHALLIEREIVRLAFRPTSVAGLNDRFSASVSALSRSMRE